MSDSGIDKQFVSRFPNEAMRSNKRMKVDKKTYPSISIRQMKNNEHNNGANSLFYVVKRVRQINLPRR